MILLEYCPAFENQIEVIAYRRLHIKKPNIGKDAIHGLNSGMIKVN